MLLSDVSIKRPVFATVAILFLVVLGAMSFSKLPVEEYPPIEFPFVAVVIVEPGASPDQIEKKVIRPVEDAFSEINGVEHIYGMGSENMGTIFAEFSMDTDPDVAVQNVRDKMSAIRNSLPSDIQEPTVMRFNMTEIPIMSVAVSGDKTRRELTYYVNDIIKKKIETVNGVGSIKYYGSQDREVRLDIDVTKLAAYGVSTAEIAGALRMGNVGVPAGYVANQEQSISLKTAGELDTMAAFLSFPVAQRNGKTILLGDVVTVIDGTKESDSLARISGKNAVGIDIVKQSGANTVEVADNINIALQEAAQDMPPGVELTVVKDNSKSIRSSVNNVIETIVEGALLAIIIVFVFLHNGQTTLIAALAIPTSIISTFFFMELFGFSLNSMSLGALALCIGLLIDDAIVVIENIERHKKMGKPPLQAAKEGASEIGLAVIATTVAVVAVFLPLGTMSGITGQFFRQFGLTAVTAAIISTFVALSLVPMLAARDLGGEIKGENFLSKYLMRFNKWFDSLAERYGDFLHVVLRHRGKTLALAFALFVGSLVMVSFLGSEFMTSSDIGEISAVLEMDAGTSLDGASELARQAEEILKSYEDVVTLYTTVQADRANIFVKITGKHERKKSDKDLAKEMRRSLLILSGAEVTVTPVSSGPGGGGEKAFQISILGDDMAQMRIYAEKIERIVESVPGAVDVSSTYKPGRPQEMLVVDHEAAGDVGVSAAQVGELLNTLYTGTVVGQFQEGDTRTDMRLRLKPEQREDLSALQMVQMPVGGGKYVYLGQVTERVFQPAPSSINRYDRKKEIQIQANIEGATLGEFNAVFNRRLAEEVELPSGLSLYQGGNTEMMNEVFSTMLMALVAGIIFIFFVLAAQFESWLEPLAIMFSLPMAAIGAFGGLMIMGSNLSIDSMIGLVLLMGLASKNGILLIDYSKLLRAKGVDRTEAMVQSGQVRLRPIMMTTLAMIFGMLPLALGVGEGAEARASMAYAIIGGLVTSTLLTLFVVPAVYTVLDDGKIKLIKKIRRWRGLSEEKLSTDISQ